MLFKNTLIFLFTVAFIGRLNAQSADEVISKYVQYIGGAQKWSTVKTIVTSGTYDYGGIVFPFTSYSKAPNLYRYIVSSNGKSFEQAFDGKGGWKIDGFKDEKQKTILTGNAATAMMNEADVELESPLINYNKKGSNAILEGIDSVNQQPCFRIRFIRNNSDTERYFFSTKNFELLKKQAISKNEEMGNIMLDIFYSDYRAINGIKMPFKTITMVGDQTILVIVIEKVDLNERVADDMFKP